MRALITAMSLVLGLSLAGAVLADSDGATAPDGTPVDEIAVPALPFDDNPDPEACGIPQRWGSDDAAWLDGRWQGELIQPTVLLYDSHLRSEVTGALPTGVQVTVVLFQDNPVLNYYMVEGRADDGTTHRGWVPAPFLVFEPPPDTGGETVD